MVMDVAEAVFSRSWRLHSHGEPQTPVLIATQVPPVVACLALHRGR